MADVLEITPTQLESMLREPDPPLVLDVREPWETEICRIDVLDEVSRRNLPRDFAGPPAPTPWDRLIGLAATALRHVHL